MLLPQFIREGAQALEPLYGQQEARSLVHRLCQDLCGWPPYQAVVHPETEVPAELEAALQRLLAGEPLQYVTGWQEFYGRRFFVRPGVLIPRPETELLVQEALSRASQLEQPRILDLCTGSGCIAWTLALELPCAAVTAVDISEEALAVARHQEISPLRFAPVEMTKAAPDEMTKAAPVEMTKATPIDTIGPEDRMEKSHGPTFIQADVLKDQPFPGGPFDILTANPPYIRESEREDMAPNVLEHEPALALFVPDEDPLRFCHAIASHAMRSLVPGGWGIVEINETLGPQSAQAFCCAGLRDVRVLQDLSGLDRFVTFLR